MSESKNTAAPSPRETQPATDVTPAKANMATAKRASRQRATPVKKVAEVASPAIKPAARRTAKAPAKTPAKPAQAPATAKVTPPTKSVASKGKAAKVEAKPEKPAKARKVKLVRDSFAMPESEYAALASLKKRLAAADISVKKSEIIRAGLLRLVAMNDSALAKALSQVERIKTGRPAKK